MDGRRSLPPHDRLGSSFFDVAHAAIGPIRNPAPLPFGGSALMFREGEIRDQGPTPQ